MAIEQTTVICECGNLSTSIWCAKCKRGSKVSYDAGGNAFCVDCNAPYENISDLRENKYFDSYQLKAAIDNWFKKGWLLHETVINEMHAILTLRRSV